MITVAKGDIFRLRHKEIEGRTKPYEFVDRIGAVTVLPVLRASGTLLTIHNQRRGYLASDGLSGGNIDGGFDEPDSPLLTAERELIEETGYGDYTSASVFALDPVSSTINYPRFFAILRGVRKVADPEPNPSEIVTLSFKKPDEYLKELTDFRHNELYPEVAIGMRKIADLFGFDALVRWTTTGTGITTGEVADTTSPHLHLLEDPSQSFPNSIRWSV